MISSDFIGHRRFIQGNLQSEEDYYPYRGRRRRMCGGWVGLGWGRPVQIWGPKQITLFSVFSVTFDSELNEHTTKMPKSSKDYQQR